MSGSCTRPQEWLGSFKEYIVRPVGCALDHGKSRFFCRGLLLQNQHGNDQASDSILLLATRSDSRPRRFSDVTVLFVSGCELYLAIAMSLHLNIAVDDFATLLASLRFAISRGGGLVSAVIPPFGPRAGATLSISTHLLSLRRQLLRPFHMFSIFGSIKLIVGKHASICEAA